MRGRSFCYPVIARVDSPNARRTTEESLKLRCENIPNKKTFQQDGINRVFRKLTTLTIMAILASDALLRQKNPVTKCYPNGIRTQAASDLKSNTILSTLT